MKFKVFSIVPVFFLCSVVAVEKGQQSDFRNVYDQDLYESALDAALCEEQMNFLVNDTIGLQFLDASAKVPSGIMSGNVNDLGDYFQCLAIDELVNNMEIQGKYCAITVPLTQENPITIPQIPEIPNIPWPTTTTGSPSTDGDVEVENEEETERLKVARQYEAIKRYALGISGFGEPVENRMSPMVITQTRGATFGVCVPKVCTATQALNFLQNRNPFVNITFNEFFCRLPKDKLFSPVDIVATVIFSLLACLLIISTTYDLCHLFWLKRDPKSANTLFRSFSIYTNTRRFLTFNKVPGALECVDGIRAISMLWVVVGHTYSFTLIGYIHNIADTITWMTKFSSTWINSAPITVDTFFCLSGILVVYTTIGKISRRRFARTIHLFYINRLLRMFPILAAVVLLQASLFNHVSDGPFWMNVSAQTQNCRTWWWSALLHVQNYVNTTGICIPQTWYLSVDVQLYFFCPIIIIWLFGREKIAWAALITIVLASLVSSSVYSFYYNFSAALFNPARLSEFAQYSTTYYVNTLTRAPPFFIGMIYGYILHLCKDKQLRISKINVILLWIFSFIMMAFCIFSIYPAMQIDHDGQIFDNFLNAYMRAIWASGLGWLIFACVHGYGGPINWFLSLQMWKLPARLSFAVYMVHVSIIMIANSSWVKTHYFTEGDNIYRFFSDVTITFVVAFILCIAIDAPFSTLQKLLLGGGGKRQQNQKTASLETIVRDEPPVIKTSF